MGVICLTVLLQLRILANVQISRDGQLDRDLSEAGNSTQARDMARNDNAQTYKLQLGFWALGVSSTTLSAVVSLVYVGAIMTFGENQEIDITYLNSGVQIYTAGVGFILFLLYSWNRRAYRTSAPMWVCMAVSFFILYRDANGVGAHRELMKASGDFTEEKWHKPLSRFMTA